MNEITKTLLFSVIGAALAAVAFVVNWQTQPKPIEEFALVGEEFFPDFDAPNEVDYLQVEAFNFDKREPKVFRVEYKNDQWKIASNYDYPAEAADRIAKTAASVIGIKREALAGRRESEHERFGVIDPSSDEAKQVSKSESESVGIRVTLGGGQEAPLVDYIIGREVKSTDDENEMVRQIRGDEAPKPRHYVRRPDEKETYIATISIDASTKFVDWIEPDLLLLESSALRKMVIDDYSIEPYYEEVSPIPGLDLKQRVKKAKRVDVDQYTLIREEDFGPWQMEGLDEEKEVLNSATVNKVIQALDNFKIEGVRPRYQVDGKTIINSELKIEFPESIATREAAEAAIRETAMDLESKGFSLQQSPVDNSLSIVANQGELSAGTGEGINYRLYFGDVFRGEDDQIELGSAGNSTTDSDAVSSTREEETASESGTDADNEADATESPDSTAGEEVAGEEVAGEGSADGDSSDADSAAKSRYVLVRAEFDVSLLGPQPTPPTPPQPPAKPPTDGATDDSSATTPPGDGDSGAGDGAATNSDQSQNSSGDSNSPPNTNSSGQSGSDTPPTSGGDGDSQSLSARQAESQFVSTSGAAIAVQQEEQNQDDKKQEEKQEKTTDPEKVGEQKQEQTDGSAGQKTDDQADPASGPVKQAGNQEGDTKPASDRPANNPQLNQDEAGATSDDPQQEENSQDENAGEGQEEVDPQVAYQQALQQFNLDQRRYQAELAQFQQRLAAGQKKAELLNARFEDWYYIISAESLQTLRISRADLVNPKPEPKTESPEGGGESGLPQSLIPNQLPSGQ